VEVLQIKQEGTSIREAVLLASPWPEAEGVLGLLC